MLEPTQKQLTQIFQKAILLSSVIALILVTSLGTIDTYSAQSNNLDTNMTSYIGSDGAEVGEAAAIGLDDTFWYGGQITNLAVNYGKNPINIQGGGTGVLLHFGTDGKTLVNILRFPSSVKDISIDKTSGKLAVIGDFGISYINPINYTELWARVLVPDGASNPENFVRGTRVDIGTNGKIATLYGKRITVWDNLGQNLTGAGNMTFGINSKIVYDIAMIDENNTVVVIGETQKDGGPCSQWRGGWMKAYNYTGTLVWNNYDWTQYEVSGSLAQYPTNNCADAMPQRVTLGADNNLYMVSKSAGGNSMYRKDPKNLNLDLQSQGKLAGGDSFNNTSNMSSQNITFMMKYAPTTGDIIKQQVWVGRLPSTAANSVVPRDIAVDASGVIAMVGDTAAYFADRLQVQTVNGVDLPVYSGYEGFYLELAPDMRTRIRATSFKKTRETSIAAVAIRGNKRVVAGNTNFPDASIQTKSPIQPNIGGGNTDGFVAAWGFETATADYAITGNRIPDTQAVTLNSNFEVKYNYSYTGTNLPYNTSIKITIPEGITYSNELYDGFNCIMVGAIKECTKVITASQWTSGGTQTITMSIPRSLAGKVDKEVRIQITPTDTSLLQADLYPSNNIVTLPITIDDTLPAVSDYTMGATLMTANPVALNGYLEVKVDYLYTGPNITSDKKLRIVVPAGLEYDPLNRAGISCGTVAGLQECAPTITKTELTAGGSRTFYFVAKSPAVLPNSKNIRFELFNNDGSTVDTTPANHSNPLVNVIVDSSVTAVGDYSIAATTPTPNTVPLGQATSLPINLKYIGNTAPISQKVSVAIPIGFSYNYIASDGWVCITISGIQTCQRTITALEWQNAMVASGLNINLNLKADTVMSTLSTKTIVASLINTAKNGPVDTTIVNNSSSVNLILTDTVIVQPTTLAIKVNLAGSYNASTSQMRTDLRNKNLIPINQPFNNPNFGYAGTESASNISTDTVDWVLVELVSPTGTTKKAALLKASGLITESDGSNLQGINAPTGTYKIVIKHRNHLVIATNQDILITSNQVTNLDLTTNANVKGSNQTMLKAGVYGLKAANTNGNNVINSVDRLTVRLTSDKLNTYQGEDVNMDGNITSVDRSITRSSLDSSQVI